MDTKLKISKELIEQVINYLNLKPHGETRQLIDSLVEEANASMPKPPAVGPDGDKSVTKELKDPGK